MKILFLSNPNNPTGGFFSRELTDRLIKQLPEHVVVVYDEVYHHYVDEPDYARAAEYIAQGYNVIGLHSFSKAYGLAGILLGYVFAGREIAAYLQKLGRPFMINSLSMEAGMAALKDTDHIDKTVKHISHEKPWMYRQLKALGIRYWDSQANFILSWSPYPSSEFIGDMFDEGIMVRGGEVFGAPGCCRVTVGTSEANKAFIGALKKICSNKVIVKV
jgi:histidinol-phosphate aminotransferase